MNHANPYAAARFNDLSSEFLRSNNDPQTNFYVREIYTLLDQFIGQEFIVNDEFVKKCYSRIEKTRNKEQKVLIFAMLSALTQSRVTVELYVKYNIHNPLAAELSKLARSKSMNEDSLDSMLMQQIVGLTDVLTVDYFNARRMCDRGVVDMLSNFLNNIKNRKAYNYSEEGLEAMKTLALRKECIGKCYLVGSAISHHFFDIVEYLGIESMQKGLVLDLYDTSGETDLNIAEELIRKNLAWPVDTTCITIPEQFEWQDIIPIRIEDPSRFWAWVGNEASDTMLKIQEKLDSFSFTEVDAIGPRPPPTGIYVAVFSPEGSFRAVVYSNNSREKTSRVFALDFGYWSVRKWEDMRFLKRTGITNKPQAIPCFIRGMSPRPLNVELYRSVIWSLANFCSARTKTAASIVIHRVANLLSDLVLCPDTQTALAAISVLNNLCYIHDYHGLLLDTRIMDSVIARLERTELTAEDVKVHKFVSRCLYCLTNLVHLHGKAQDKFFKLNGFCIVLALAQKSGRKDLFGRFYQLLRAMIQDSKIRSQGDDHTRRRSDDGMRGRDDRDRRFDDMRRRSRSLGRARGRYHVDARDIPRVNPRNPFPSREFLPNRGDDQSDGRVRSRGHDNDSDVRKPRGDVTSDRNQLQGSRDRVMQVIDTRGGGDQSGGRIGSRGRLYGPGDESTFRYGEHRRAVSMERLREVDLHSTDDEAYASGDQSRVTDRGSRRGSLPTGKGFFPTGKGSFPVGKDTFPTEGHSVTTSVRPYSSCSESEDEPFIPNTTEDPDDALDDDDDLNESLIPLKGGKLDENAQVEYYIEGFKVRFKQDQRHEIQTAPDLQKIQGAQLLRIICGFINSGEEGSIYYGINPVGEVKGMCIKRRERDAFRLGVDDIIGQIQPKIGRSPCDVIFCPVVESEGHDDPETRKLVEDTFVIEIRVSRLLTDVLYTCKGENKAHRRVYVRRQGRTLEAIAQDIREVAFRHQELIHHETLTALRKKLETLRSEVS